MENGEQPATKKDVETAIDAAIGTAKGELLEAMRGMETRLLHAFNCYAKSNDGRLLEAAIESRLMEVERRLNLPPAA